MKNALLPLVTVLSLAAFATNAAAPAENFKLTVPPHYKLASKNENAQIVMSEFVPEDQSIKDWSDMYSAQILRGAPLKNVSAEQFLKTMTAKWIEACNGAKMEKIVPEQPSAGIANMQSNGYLQSFAYLRCPKNPATGKPENAIFSVIKGKTDIYVMQRAAKTELTEAQFKEAMGFLTTSTICDNTKEHPCVDAKK